jgi:hypothetical protein
MLAEVRTGIVASGDGAVNPARASRDGSLVIGAGMADYQELAYRGKVFQASNQGPGGTTTTIGLATTYTGLCVSNPAGANVNLVMLQYGIAVVGAPAALATVGLLGGYAVGGVTAHTTPLVPLSTFMNTAVATGQAKADAAATLVGTPTLLMALGVTPITGATAQVVNPPVILNVYDFKGSFILPPGAYIAAYTSTVLSVIASFTWAEVPV